MEALLLAWYSQNARDLPWRHTRDPYAILVSEVMLQQTQVSRVLPRYLDWLERWPDVESLAAAPAGDVIRAWSGLGYNRRAINLHRTAQAVAGRGRFPREIPELEALPGIGPYTARALACFAFGDPDYPPPPGRAFDWNQALFDLGSTVCLARRPRCAECPLAVGCPSAGTTFAPQRKQGPFEGSFRQRRSRLLRSIADAGALDADGLDGDALIALMRDGLVVIADGRAQLPA